MGMGCEVEEKGTQISEQNWGRSEPGLLEKRFQNISLLLASFKSLQSCLTLCKPMDCSPPGSSVHGILQARILEWVAIPFSRGSSWPRDWTQVSCIAGGFFTVWATRETHTRTFWFLPPLKTQPHSFFLPSLPCLLFHRVLLHGSNNVPMGTLAPVCFVYPSLLHNPLVDFSTESF